MRRTLLSIRRALTPEHKQSADARLCAQVLHWCQSQAIRRLGVYLPIRGEPVLMPAYRQLHAAGIHLALPVVIDKEAPLRFVAWAPEDELIAGAYGTRVPARHDIVLPDALLIPCVGFNTARFRVGYGGGFYDRTLAQATRPLTLGVAYEATLASFTPDAHDIALDTIITEEKQYRTA